MNDGSIDLSVVDHRFLPWKYQPGDVVYWLPGDSFAIELIVVARAHTYEDGNLVLLYKCVPTAEATNHEPELVPEDQLSDNPFNKNMEVT